MRPEERDPGYVWDMLDAARSVREFTSGVTQSRPSKANHVEIPWKEIIGQRNVLAHEYGEINQERIWSVASRRIPELIRLLEPLLPPPPTT